MVDIFKISRTCYDLKNRTKDRKWQMEIIEIMGELNPQFRDIVDFKHKLWDHLFLISNFQLDVDSPYEKPVIENYLKSQEQQHTQKTKLNTTIMAK